MGVGFDGDQIFFAQFKGDRNKPITEVNKKDFVLIGPFPFHYQSARTFLTYLRGLSRQFLTAEDLARVFGPKSKIAPLAVSAFANALENWGSTRVKICFNEWKRLFGIVYGEQFSAHQREEAEALSKLYGVGKEIDFQELLSSVHTYFALLMKFIAAEIITLKESSLSSCLSQNMTHASKEELKSFITDIEDGWIYSRRGITNYLEGDFFRWYRMHFHPDLKKQ